MTNSRRVPRPNQSAPNDWISGRPVVYGKNGVISSGHYLTSMAGMRMMLAGGNAFDAMVAAGAVDEVAALLPSHLDPNLPAMKALGVPEFARYLRGECQLAEAVEKAKQATRNFAKRQFTWFRNQIAADLVFEGFGDTEAATSAAFRLLEPLQE